MKFASCINLNALDKLETLKNLGYDGYETGLAAIEVAKDEDIAAMAEKSKELGMPCFSHNGMFPATVPLLCGKEGYGAVEEYLERALTKAKPLGSPVIVLGSGKAREIPEGMSKEEAKERFGALLADVVAPYARKFGVTIAIEELRAQECNFINNCKEAMEIIRAVNDPAIQLLIDYYHSMLGGDTLEELASYGDAIRHVHIASPKNNRFWPTEMDFDDCRDFFACLKKAGYDGVISLEGSSGSDFAGAATVALDIMKRAL